MNKTERQSRIKFEIDYQMEALQKSKSDYWATRSFECLNGMLIAYHSIGEITKIQYDELQNKALNVLSEVRVLATLC